MKELLYFIFFNLIFVTQKDSFWIGKMLNNEKIFIEQGNKSYLTTSGLM